MSSHLRVELRSPKRGLVGGYGFDLTKYCACCWSRLGRILKRGARCGACRRRVCKRCRHFLGAKEWVCSLCYKKRYAPEDFWHDDANTRRFQGSQGKSGSYLPRLTDWSFRGMIATHTSNEFQPRRIHFSYEEPLPPVSSKNKFHNSRCLHSKSYYSPTKRTYYYPLTEKDIELKNWRPLNDAMNPQNHKESHLKYTSVNLKQKRREIRELKALGKGRHLDGTFHESPKRKGYFSRISSTKREHLQSAKTLYYDYNNTFRSSARRSKSNTNSSANPSWHKTSSRRGRRSSSNFSHPPILYRDEPHVRLSVRGTRIFGRRKSYRACPTLKGVSIKSKSTSLPCELSQVESHDYEFWNSGFVQTRVKKLEEELTAKCDDKFSFTHDYEVQSLCSLQLDKIIPDRDDYRIAYLSSTSQESSLDYVDDNYYSIGMGTLDVKLNKKCLITGSEDWDLTFSSSEEIDTSSDDDEFFYRKCTNAKSDSMTNYYSKNNSIIRDVVDDSVQASRHGKICSVTSENVLLDAPKSIKQQIHDSVDRIFYDVMHCDLDIEFSPEVSFDEISGYTPHALIDGEKQNVYEINEKEQKSQSEVIFSDVSDDTLNIFENHTIDSKYETQSEDLNCAVTGNNILPNTISSIIIPKYFTNENAAGYNSGNSDKTNVAASTMEQFLEDSTVCVKQSTENQRTEICVPDDFILKAPPDTAYVLENIPIDYSNVEKLDFISKSEFTCALNKIKQEVQLSTASNSFSNISVEENHPTQVSVTEQIPDVAKCKNARSNFDNQKENSLHAENMSYSPIDSIIRSKSKIWNKMCHNIENCSRRTNSGRYPKLEEVDIVSSLKSVLEVDLSLYEPLSTPFAEIYFITYGKNYPNDCNYVISIPRIVLRDAESEITNIVSHTMHNSNTVCNLSNIDKLFVKKWNSSENSVIYNFLLRNVNEQSNCSICNCLNRIIFEPPDVIKLKKCNCENTIVKCVQTSNTDSMNFNAECYNLNEYMIHNYNPTIDSQFLFSQEKIKHKTVVNSFVTSQDSKNTAENIINSNNFLALQKTYSFMNTLLLQSDGINNIYKSIPVIQSNFTKFSFLKKSNKQRDSIQQFGNLMIRECKSDISELLEKSELILQTFKDLTKDALRISFLPPILPMFSAFLFTMITDKRKLFLVQDEKFSFKLMIEMLFTDLMKTWKIAIIDGDKNCTQFFNTLKADKFCFHSSSQQNTLCPQFHKRNQLTPRNRNYWSDRNSRKETEITNEVPPVGETSESRFASESQPLPATSLTGNAAFVEYLFLRQLASVRDRARARLPVVSSPIQLGFQTVPAVQRNLVDRESWTAQSNGDRIHGSLWAGATVTITDNDCYPSDFQNIVFINSFRERSLLDCCESDRIINSDHDRAAYRSIGNVPEGSEHVSFNLKAIGDINCNIFNPTSERDCALPHNMASSDADPRLVNKITRTPGKNISKLKKLFDSRENSSSHLDITCAKSVENNSSSQYLHTNTLVIMDSETTNTDVNSECESMEEESVSVANSNEISKRLENDDALQKAAKIPPDIPFCRKVTSGGDLWKNVDIGIKSQNEGLWSNALSSDSNYNNFKYDESDVRQFVNPLISSTADLHNLIASSRAELSKKKEPEISDKSTLENYFTSFEHTKPKQFMPLISDQSFFTDSTMVQYSDYETYNSSTSSFDCDVNEMSFEEEEAALSDTSSDEEIRCNPTINTHYIPTYSLHTIIEESCEESSRGATPTNEPTASKLERYFSWDIINEAETDKKQKSDDNSTVYSDSLSEDTSSLNGDVSKEIDPLHLASSRLEKYFTSGLVGNENYYYPDDAEFLEDGPVSDFEEDSVHQKISRSALLSSLETLCENQKHNSNEFVINENVKDDVIANGKSFYTDEVFIKNDVPFECNYEKVDDYDLDASKEKDVDKEISPNVNYSDICDSKELEMNEITNNKEEKSNFKLLDSCSSDTVVVNSEEIQSEKLTSEIIENIAENDGLTPKQTVNKEQLAIDVQAIIKKLLLYFSDSRSNSFKSNKESDYISAWTILETEIERLIQSISPTASLENNSCNCSTIDSNNSDYGSDTIESLDCMTDEDEGTDSKNRSNAKYPIVDLFNATYKIKPGHDFHNFNISDETLSIWKRLIQSLQKDNFCINDDKLYDPNTEARLYIRDQIVNLMHTVTVNDNKTDEIIEQNSSKINEKILHDEEKEIESLIEESNTSGDINEAYNVSIGDSNLLSCLTANDNIVIANKTELSEEILLENLEPIEHTENSINSQDQFSNDPDIIVEKESIDRDLNKNLMEDLCVSNDTNMPNINLCSDKLNVDEVDLKSSNSFSRKSKNGNRNFSVFVDIELSDKTSHISEKLEGNSEIESSSNENVIRSSFHMWVPRESEGKTKEDDITDEIDLSQFSLPPENANDTCMSSDAKNSVKSHRDTGYYSFKSSEDSLLNDTPPPDEFMDVPNFKSLKRSVKKFPLSNTLSKSTNNINQVLSVSDSKFSTLQLKSHKSKGTSSSNNSPSRQFTSLFSPSAVFKKLTGSKNNDAQTSESSIPPKYLKKYARSSSNESDGILGAISMPQLNVPKTGDSYSALGLYSENDRDSSLIDDDADARRYSAYSHSVLSLGAHSASMTSVYSAAGCHYGYVTVSGDVLFGLNYNQKSQMMEVFVKQCRNLAAVDIRKNRSDPYVKVYLLPDKTKGGKRKTKTKKNALNPIFNELLRFPVLKHELESRTLWLSVWNSDLFGRNDFLGEVTLPLGYRLLDSPTLRWYPLQERMESLTSPLNYKGELFLALKYVPRDLSLESRFRPAPVISLRGALHVLVKEARNISANGNGGNLDAFCKSYLLPDKSKSSKQKTPVVKRSRHPKWYYTMIYEDMSIEELKERSLELTVWDHDKITSNEFMGGVRLNLGSGLYHGVMVDWMDGRRDEVSLWEAMLQSPNMWVDGCLLLRPTMQFHHG